MSDTPTDYRATRLSSGLAHVRLSWSNVSGANGYEVYYEKSNIPVSIVNTSSTTVDITSGFLPRTTHTFYVVSYRSGASLPSGNASVTLTFSKSIFIVYFIHVILVR